MTTPYRDARAPDCGTRTSRWERFCAAHPHIALMAIGTIISLLVALVPLTIFGMVLAVEWAVGEETAKIIVGGAMLTTIALGLFYFIGFLYRECK